MKEKINDVLRAKMRVLYFGRTFSNQLRVFNSGNVSVNDLCRAEAQRVFEETKKRNPFTYNAKAKVLDKLFVENFKVSVKLLDMDYATGLVSQKKYDWPFNIMPVGLNVFLITSDKKIVLQKRSENVEFPGKIGLIAGGLDNNNPFGCMYKEIEEEACIKRNQIQKMIMTGITRRCERGMLSTEFAFSARTMLTGKEVLRRNENNKQEGEIFLIDSSPDSLRSYILKNYPKIAGFSLNAMILGGAYCWGNEYPFFVSNGYIQVV